MTNRTASIKTNEKVLTAANNMVSAFKDIFFKEKDTTVTDGEDKLRKRTAVEASNLAKESPLYKTALNEFITQIRAADPYFPSLEDIKAGKLPGGWNMERTHLNQFIRTLGGEAGVDIPNVYDSPMRMVR